MLFGLHAAKQAQAASETEAGPSGVKTSAGLAGQASDLPIQLSAMRKADVSDFKGTMYINIREYYEVSLAICCLSRFEPVIACPELCLVTQSRDGILCRQASQQKPLYSEAAQGCHA